MDEYIRARLKELEGLTFSNPKEAKELLRTLKRHEPKVYEALITHYEESWKPQIVDGCLIGYRAWDIITLEEGFRLASHGNTVWEPYEALEAKCHISNHRAPRDGCDCGIYAVNHRREPWFKNGVFGKVKLWGNFLEGSEKVYRAQYAYPESFDFVFCTRCRKQCQFSECNAFLNIVSYSPKESISFMCKNHMRSKGPLMNLYVPASYVVGELHKEYGLEQPESVEGFIESLNLEGI